jgi:hypothetical protein
MSDNGGNQSRRQNLSKSCVEQKAELMKQAETIIDELLDWQAETDRPNFEQIEGKVLELRERLSQEMARVTVAGQDQVRPVPGPLCPGCEKEMRYKGMKENRVSSWVGEVSYQRGYYYCDECEQGLFPPGQAT